MKTTKFFLSVALAASLIAGCKKDDTTAPVVTINGQSEITLNLGDPYTDAGATANDDNDGSVSVSTSGLPDVTTEGDYTVTYTATDAAGNDGTATRLVHVIIVRNTYLGNYTLTSGSLTVAGSTNPEITYGTQVSTSSTANRIIIENFGNVTGSNVYATVSGHSFTIPAQSFTSTTLGLINITSGNGTINSKGEVIDLTYSGSASSIAIGGVEKFTKN